MSIAFSSDGVVGYLTLENPPHNILTRGGLDQLRQYLAECEEEAQLRAVVLRAAGKNFSAGADVGEHLPPTFERMIPEFLETVMAIRSFPLPTIAAVKGLCLGGGFELVQACDMIVAGEDARFAQPEIQLGVTAPAASITLPRHVGWGRAAQMLFTGSKLSATEALDAGLVVEVVRVEELDAAVEKLIEPLRGLSGAALRSLKKTMLSGEARHFRDAIEMAGDIYVRELMTSKDAVEGLQAFVEKRQPTWSHN